MSHLDGDSAKAAVSAVKGINTAVPVSGVVGSCVGLEGASDAGWGVYGHSKTGRGVVAISEGDYGLRAHSDHSAGVRGSSGEGRGVEGWATKSEGVVGISTAGNGVWGQTDAAGVGTLGTSRSGPGVLGSSQTGNGVQGESHSNYGVAGFSQTFPGVRGTSVSGRGLEGFSTSGDGVVGMTVNGSQAVWGQTDTAATGVLGTSGHGVGVWGKGGRLAAFFEGNVEITGDLRMSNGDCAEDFDVIDVLSSEPGTVMVLGEEGALAQCSVPYDKRVAGVISGAGSYRPGITLDKQPDQGSRAPIGLLGKVFCKVDAQYGAIDVGDLLTTSATAGHAMKAGDPLQAFGSVIGKALRPLRSGQGLVPILITLQ
jgi:hypothetical protein